jgi:hypothetical protein
MIHDVPKPETSPAFTIEDIRKIREWHYEILKDATSEDQINFYRKESADGYAQIEAIRATRKEKAV